MLMKHFLFYLIALTVCLPFASCSDEFVELPYVYDEMKSVTDVVMTLTYL